MFSRKQDLPVESKTRTYHGQVWSGRTAGRRVGAQQDRTPTKPLAQDTSVIRISKASKKYRECFSRSTNKRNFIYTDGGTQRPVDNRMISSVVAGREMLLVLGCRPVDRSLFVFVTNFHSRHVAKENQCKPMEKQNLRLATGLSMGQKTLFFPAPHPWNKSRTCLA